EMFVLSKDEKLSYVSNEENSTVQVIDIADKIIIHEIPTGAEPEGVMLSPDGATLYVTSEIADMVPDAPGIWLFHCHLDDHMEAGMMARYEVLPAPAATADTNQRTR
ncbi:MAG: multicopper oxidase domain-containing protein, partial [Vicinamibacterales bacterium]